ncbi:hypothetical protein [Erwinia amylovora]|uniref:Uncharacterized protein n=1 Tax=Erwinia amylovora TaxID=552 RepID=A0ABX7MLM6_ERWAM|nr:hypothetical protein [Erwinia amylovora]MBZ2388133.1 hypothetical protein [Erwinia amylovora]MBZ2394457.1 hypothetical protein [Erwinia amylovora]MCK8155489.1 hypothetical protein [Erwinia amylovora]MCK8158790.1 hypothetical protein [Erwinia amylovora]MCK8162173.1 hypothetical protein [Erwinia amylovora]
MMVRRVTAGSVPVIWPHLSGDGNLWLIRAARMPSTAMPGLPSTPFIKPGGQDNAEVITQRIRLFGGVAQAGGVHVRQALTRQRLCVTGA